MAAAFRVVPYIEHVFVVDLPGDASIFALAATAMVMQLFGRRADRWFAARTDSESKLPAWFASWEAAAMPVTLGAVAWWFASALPNYFQSPAHWSGLMLTVLLFCQALVSPGKGFGEVTLGFALTLFGLHVRATDWLAGPGLLLAVTVQLLCLHVYSRVTRKRTDRLATAFSRPAHYVSCGLILVAAGTSLFSVASAAWSLQFSVEVSIAGLIATAWCLREGAYRQWLMMFGFVSLLAWQCVFVGEYGNLEWLPAVWAGTTLIGLRFSRRPAYSCLEPLLVGVLAFIAVASLLFSEPPSRSPVQSHSQGS